MATKKRKDPKKVEEKANAPPLTKARQLPEAPVAPDGDGTKATPGVHRGGRGFGKGFPW